MAVIARTGGLSTPPVLPLVMRARLGELGVCWIQIACSCGRSCTIHLHLLVQRHGAGTQIGAILPRLKCKQCGQAPYRAELTERPDTGAWGGGTGSWSIPLIGEGKQAPSRGADRDPEQGRAS